MFHVALIKVPVTDIAASARFYGALLDMEPTVEAPEFGWCHFEAEALTLALYVTGKGGGSRAPGGSLDFQLTHEDIDACLERIAPRASDAAIHDNDDGSRSLEMTDPDGNEVKILGMAKAG